MTLAHASANIVLLAMATSVAFGVQTVSRVARAAAMARGLPLKVPTCVTASGRNKAITSRRPPKAPNGKPPPIDFDTHTTSGVTPNDDDAPPHAAVMPDLTSSNTSSVPV